MDNLKNTEDELFSKFSHDLRGSFVSILGYTELLNDPTENVNQEELNDFVKRIDFRTKEAYELLDNFINWLKLERYNKKLIKEKNSLLDCILEAKFSVDKIFKQKSISIINEVKNNATVFIDLQILQGIIKNIFKFISRTIENDSKLKISYVDYSKNVIVKFEFPPNLEKHQIEELSNLKLEESNISNTPNEILFVKKFIELSNGKFELFAEGNIKIVVSLPKE